MRPSFDPDRVASLETAGWRAYATRQWPRFLLAMTRMNHEQFRIPFPLSLLASWYVTRAGVAWVPVDHDERVVRNLLAQYYALGARYSGLPFDPGRAADGELRYWEVHRRLSGVEDKQEFEDALTELHAELFGISPEAARESAALRTEANRLYDRIILGETPGTPDEWRAIQLCLQRCYRSARAAMDQRSA